MTPGQDLIESAKLFAGGLIRRWYYFLIAFLADPFGLLEFLTGFKIVMPSWAIPLLLLLSFVIAAVLAYHDLRIEKAQVVQKLQDATSRRLEIVFGAGHPFEQMDPVVDSHSNRALRRLYRIGVRNAGGTTVKRVQVQLERIKPPRGVRVPIQLRVMHSRPVNGDLASEFSLDHGQTAYVDVVTKDEWRDRGEHPLVVPHAVSDTGNQLPSNDSYTFTLLAHGEAARSDRATFRASVDEENRLIFLRSPTK